MCYINSLEDVPSVPIPNSVQELLDKHSTLFNPELGCYKGSPLELPVTSQPGFYKPCVVPYALRDRVKIALDKMESDGVIVKVDSSPVAAPLVNLMAVVTYGCVVILVLHTIAVQKLLLIQFRKWKMFMQQCEVVRYFQFLI